MALRSHALRPVCACGNCQRVSPNDVAAGSAYCDCLALTMPSVLVRLRPLMLWTVNRKCFGQPMRGLIALATPMGIAAKLWRSSEQFKYYTKFCLCFPTSRDRARCRHFERPRFTMCNSLTRTCSWVWPCGLHRRSWHGW